MKNLVITRIKPNPRGKDRPRRGPIDPSELAAEWVDIKNTSSVPVSIEGVGLYHRAYDVFGKSDWALVRVLAGTLPAGQTLRVHAGEQRHLSVVRSEDIAGAELHCFSGTDRYVWNNRQGDQPALTFNQQWVDHASYDPSPPEGVVLARQGDKLVAYAASAL